MFREAERVEQIYNEIPEEVIDEAAFGPKRYSIQPQMTLTKPSIMTHRDSVAQYSANRLNVQRPSYYSSKNSMYQSNSSMAKSEGDQTEAGKCPSETHSHPGPFHQTKGPI